MIRQDPLKQLTLHVDTPAYVFDRQILFDKRPDLLSADRQIFFMNLMDVHVFSFDFYLNRPPVNFLCFLIGNTASSLS